MNTSNAPTSEKPFHSKLYFAYGANICPLGMTRRCPQAQAIGTYYLRDWQLEFRHHATIVPAPGSYVPGVLWKLTADCESQLDNFEGYPYYYNKTLLMQGPSLFFAYVMADNQPGTPMESYIQTIAHGYQHWQLPMQPLEDALERVGFKHSGSTEYHCH